MLSITKEFHFSAAHRIEGHPKCGRLHGHNYRLEVTIIHPGSANTARVADVLDDKGFLIDFGDLKEIVKDVVNMVDHHYIVSDENLDADCPYYRAAALSGRLGDIAMLSSIKQSSAELLSRWFSEVISEALALSYPHLAVAEVKLWETPTAYATY